MNDYQPYLNELDQHFSAMQALLINWVNINSGSCHIEGIEEMISVVTQAYAPLGADVNVIPLQPMKHIDDHGQFYNIEVGSALQIVQRPEAKQQVLLCGHLDTVYPPTSLFQTVEAVDDNTLKGPGVSDMKGGLVVMLYALMALEKSPFAKNMGWQVLLVPDEEIGSLSSSALLTEQAKHYHLGLVYEPAKTPEGSLVHERSGSAKHTIIMHGKAAHAGRDFHHGHNAIVALAKVIESVHRLNNQRDGLTINVGKVHGGGVLNVVADVAFCQLDIRMKKTEDGEWVHAQLESIVEAANEQPNFSCEMEGIFGRKPKLFDEKTQALFEIVKQCGSELGLTIDWQHSGGCCDGNNLASEGLAVVDTLGVRGGHIHSVNEYVLLDSLVERAKLSALLLMKLAGGDVLWEPKS